MNKSTILFWAIFVVPVVVYHRIFVLVETYPFRRRTTNGHVPYRPLAIDLVSHHCPKTT
ncbi:hypothetical protein ACTWQL_08595 [Pseudalkalibacillus sp. R45]|uniref:hypothetical protein n=1 Tax=Pseudalkalibacillus sp. R45 TaxID=3457433 RepID=UPI003FCD79A7